MLTLRAHVATCAAGLEESERQNAALRAQLTSVLAACNDVRSLTASLEGV